MAMRFVAFFRLHFKELSCRLFFEVARNKVTLRHFLQFRCLPRTDTIRVRATRMKLASWRRINCARDFPSNLNL